MKQKFFRITLILLIITTGTLVFSQQGNLFVRDILDNPQRYYNLSVTLQGEVTQVFNAPNPQQRGYYYLMDNSDKNIKVIANTLPAPNQKVVISGVVQVDTSTQTAYLREVSRAPFGGMITPGGEGNKKITPPTKEEPNYLLYGLIALIFIIIIALIIVSTRKTSSAAPAPQQAAPPTPGPVTPKVEEGTREVSFEEVNRQVGGMKTKEVPTLLAQLVVLTGAKSGKSFPLAFETNIGKVQGDITLEDASVSRKHAKIVFANNAYVLENISKTNPTILNGERLSASKELKDGDEIIMGVIKLQFKLI